MLKNINDLKREVFVNVNGELHKVSFTNYNEIVDDIIFLSQQDFIEKYRINFASAIQDLHLVDVFHFKTFDGGEIEIELHKFDGDYDFKYKTKGRSEQSQKIQEDFETLWANDDLAVLLF